MVNRPWPEIRTQLVERVEALDEAAIFAAAAKVWSYPGREGISLVDAKTRRERSFRRAFENKRALLESFGASKHEFEGIDGLPLLILSQVDPESVVALAIATLFAADAPIRTRSDAAWALARSTSDDALEALLRAFDERLPRAGEVAASAHPQAAARIAERVVRALDAPLGADFEASKARIGELRRLVLLLGGRRAAVAVPSLAAVLDPGRSRLSPEHQAEIEASVIGVLRKIGTREALELAMEIGLLGPRPSYGAALSAVAIDRKNAFDRLGHLLAPEALIDEISEARARAVLNCLYQNDLDEPPLIADPRWFAAALAIARSGRLLNTGYVFECAAEWRKEPISEEAIDALVALGGRVDPDRLDDWLVRRWSADRKRVLEAVERRLAHELDHRELGRLRDALER